MNYNKTERTLDKLTSILTRIQIKATEHKTSIALLQLNGFGDYGPEIERLRLDRMELELQFNRLKHEL